MRTEDSPRFKTAMASLEIAYGRKHSDPTTTLFWKRLRDAPIEKIEQAIDQWIDHNNRFPRPAELRELCGLNPTKGGPATKHNNPYARLPPDIVAFCVERGYLDPHEYFDRYKSYQRPDVCQCWPCRKAKCAEGPILEPRMVPLLDGRSVQMGFELHGDDLNECIAARDAYRLSIKLWGQKNNVITFENGSTVTFGATTPEEEHYVGASETFDVYAEDE